MGTTIRNNGASIKIDNGSTIRNIMKNQIIEVSVIKTNVIKIDIGQGALYNIYVSHAEVSIPVTATPGDLRDAINDFMANTVSSGGGGGATGGATEVKQDDEIARLDSALIHLSSINSNVYDTTLSLGKIETGVNILDIFRQPGIVDESNPRIIYNAYSQTPGAETTDPVWAILRITVDDGIKYYKWAAGNRNFDKRWADRETLSYS